MPRTEGLVRILFPSTAEVARAMTKDLSEIAGIKSHTNIDGMRVETIRFKNGGELIRRYGADGTQLTYEATKVKFEACGDDIFVSAICFV